MQAGAVRQVFVAHGERCSLPHCCSRDGIRLPDDRSYAERSEVKMRAKGDLPTKICERCGRPFAWRKKWKRDWDKVRYCSERCRRAGRTGSANLPDGSHQ
ncbi:DUF2256 domain-containing protein [Amaricoccus macauensis]|uniref:DUF2256 domain-containing protein n=1 Tax=Amaricoccus macauensis TaxID=57001 RepID=UPI003C7D94FD